MLEDDIIGIISKQLRINKKKIGLDHKFVNDLGADSLNLIKITMAIEEKYGIDISDEDAEKIITVRELVNYIKTNVKEYANKQKI